MAARIAYLLALCILSTAVQAGEPLPGYEPELRVAGAIRVSGDAADRVLIEDLQTAFARYQPAVKFENWLYGPESTIAAVYTGTADLAFMAREIREPMERMAFEWVKLTKPYEVKYANAGFDRKRPATQLAVFVHVDNPVESLSMVQLDAIFGAEHKRGDTNIRSWDGLNAGEDFQTRPIRLFGPDLDSVPALFFRRTVMLDSRKWNPGFIEFCEAREAVDAVARDSSGIAFAPLAFHRPGVKSLAIASGNGKQGVSLTRETVISGEYPLSRSVAVVLHRAEDREVAAPMREFLRFLLSAEGQRVVEPSGAYLPLGRASVLEERERLRR